MPPKKAKNEKKAEISDSVHSSQNSSKTDLDFQQQKIVPITMNAQRMELEKKQVLCDLEENINDSFLSGDMSNISAASVFSKDLIDACANASAEMLDLHLTPYDLKSVHEYQISNDKKLDKLMQILDTVLSDNAELKHKLAEVQSDLSEAKKLIHFLTSQRNGRPAFPPETNFSSPNNECIDFNKELISNELFKTEDFPALGQPLKQPNCPPKRGWEIAAAHIPQRHTSREILKKESGNLEIAGDIPQGSLCAIKEILIQRINKSMSPILNGIGRELTVDDISHIYDFSEKKKNTLVARFNSTSIKEFVYKQRKKLVSGEKEESSWKLYLTPHLDHEDSSNQLKIIKNFKDLRQKIGEDFNFRVYGAGYFIKIITHDAKHWYSYNSKLSPKQFLISKGVIVE